MQLLIPLDKMTTSKKLDAIEEIWADLSRNPGELASPSWHEDVLRSREGETELLDWEDVKSDLRNLAWPSMVIAGVRAAG